MYNTTEWQHTVCAMRRITTACNHTDYEHRIPAVCLDSTDSAYTISHSTQGTKCTSMYTSSTIMDVDIVSWADKSLTLPLTLTRSSSKQANNCKYNMSHLLYTWLHQALRTKSAQKQQGGRLVPSAQPFWHHSIAHQQSARAKHQLYL